MDVRLEVRAQHRLHVGARELLHRNRELKPECSPARRAAATEDDAAIRHESG